MSITRRGTTDGLRIATALGLDDPATWAAFTQGELITESSRGFVRRVALAGGETVYYKFYARPRPGKRLLSLGRRARAIAEYDALEFLRKAGIDAVPPLAAAAQRCCGFAGGSFLITRAVLDAASVETWLRDRREGRDPIDLPRRRRGLGALAALVRRMHDLGFAAHDLYFRNILVAPVDTPAPTFRFVMLDFPSATIPRQMSPVSFRGAAYDLAALDKDAPRYLTRTDRLRFFAAYLGRGAAPADRPFLALIERIRTRQLAKRARKQLAREARARHVTSR